LMTVALVTWVLGPAARAGPPTVFTVTLTSDQADADAGDGICDWDIATPGEQCTLRAAMNQSNFSSFEQPIAFDIGGGGHQTIQPTSALPTVVDPMVIDGTTQPGFSGTPLIEINGDNAGDVDGLTITTGETTVRGLAVTGFDGVGGGGRAGILISGLGGNTIRGNYLGFDPSSGVSEPNWWGIQIVGSPDNVVGGTTAAARNVASGNSGGGIHINGSGADDNIIRGNYAGTDPAGTAALGNVGVGVQVSNGPHDTVIGGTAPGAGNLISGNSFPALSSGGVLLSGDVTGTLIQGNLIGTDRTGTAALGNTGPGVWPVNGASAVTIGGTDPGAGNVISGNNGHGINLGGNGAFVSGGNNIVRGNLIGTDRTGTQDLGNTGWGVATYAQNNRIGGASAAAANTIAFNAAGGVVVVQDVTYTGHTIRRNSIHSNDRMGIDLDSDGVTPNDDDDPDTGANTLLNVPIVDFVQPTPAGTTIEATIDTAPNADLTVEFFASDAADPSGSGEGRRFLGATPNPVSSGVDGHQGFSQEVPGKVTGGEVVTATATDSGGNTSEFSVAVPVCTDVGTAGPDLLVGTNGRDVLCGLGGNDKLTGQGGDDVLLGGPGNDTMRGGPGDDIMLGERGTDTVSYAKAGARIRADLRAGSASGEGFDQMAGVERLIGSAKGDRLAGSAKRDVLKGLGGPDRLVGLDGRDRLLGGPGNDLLTGQGGPDVLGGAAGNDDLRGGPANDVLKGGPGHDDLDGGPGSDACRQGPGGGRIIACER
jgi:Ca2+-binding RTX toxin-like protein